MGTVKFATKEIKDQLVLIRTFSGNIAVPEVIDSFEYMLSHYFIEEHQFCGLINDLSDAHLDFKLSEFRSMVKYIKNNTQLTSVQYAVIVNSPVNSLFPSLVSRYVGISIKPFKVLEDALHWFEKLSASKAS